MSRYQRMLCTVVFGHDFQPAGPVAEWPDGLFLWERCTRCGEWRCIDPYAAYRPSETQWPVHETLN